MGVATAPTAAGMSSSTAAMRMSLRIRTMARASFFIHFLPKSIFSPFQRKTTFLVFPIYFIIVLSLWVSRDNPSAMTERASRLSESLCAARSSAFVRARLSHVLLPIFPVFQLFAQGCHEYAQRSNIDRKSVV